MQIKDTKYIIYAEGTMSQDGRTNALYQRKNGAPVYTYGAYADRFDKAEADRRTAYKGKYKWIARPVNDAEMILDYNRAVQENKLTSYSLEFRNKLRSTPEKAKSILFEARAVYDNVVADTDEDDKKQVREAADKHWNDLQKFAESLKVSTKDKLIQSSSEEAFSKNVSTEIKAGKDPKQAAAIAYSIQKENDSNMKDKKDRFYTVGTKLKYGKDILVVTKVDSNYIYLKHPNGKVYAYNPYDLSQSLEMSPQWSYADSAIKDSLNVTVKLNGKTYKGAFNGISGADKRFGDVYIPELVSLHSGDKGVFNPDEGNYVSDGKFYFKMENLKKWNPFLKDYIKDSDVTDAYPPNSFIYKGLERRIVLAAHDIAKLNALIDDVNRQFDLSKEERDKLVKLAQWYVSQKQQADSMKDSKYQFNLKPGKPVINTQPVKVIAKKAMEMQDGCSRHYLEVEDCDGKRFYMVTDEYDGCSRQFAGGGSVIEDKALLNKKYKDDLASGLTSVGRSAISGAKEVKSKIEQASRDDAVDLEMYKKPLDNLMQCGQVKDGVSASKVDAMLGINDLNTTKQLLRDAGIKYSAVTSKVSQYKIVEGNCVKVEE